MTTRFPAPKDPSDDAWYELRFTEPLATLLALTVTPAPATAAVITALRAAGAPAPGPDRWLAPEIETAVQLVASGGVVTAAESVTGPLN